MTTRSKPMGIPPHCYDPSVGGVSVDRYIGTSFDIVYEVYKRLPDFPVVLNFIQHWIPIMNELEPKVHDIVDNLHPDVVEKHGQIEIWHSETEQNKNLAEQARDAAEGYRDAALEFRNEAEGFRDESEGFRDQNEQYVQIVQQGFVDLKTELEGIYTPQTRIISAGTGLEGGGNLSANRTLSVKYGTAAGTAAQGNDSRLSNSREWTAAVVTQAEAETGTATTARKWTAQRVAQAISALSLKIGTTASTAKAGNWEPTWANVTGKPTTFAPSAHTHSLAQITDAGNVASLNTNASTANFLRGDGTWATPPNTNTTYAEITTAEINAGTASTLRTISGRRMKYALDKKSDTDHAHPISQVTSTTGTITEANGGKIVLKTANASMAAGLPVGWNTTIVADGANVNITLAGSEVTMESGKGTFTIPKGYAVSATKVKSNAWLVYILRLEMRLGQ